MCGLQRLLLESSQFKYYAKLANATTDPFEMVTKSCPWKLSILGSLARML